MREGLSRRQRQVLGLEDPAGSGEPEAPSAAEMVADEAEEAPALVTAPGALRGAHWRPSRKAVLGVLACVVVALVVIGARTWWGERRAQEARPVAPVATGTQQRESGRHGTAGATRSAAASPAATPPAEVLVHVVGRVRRPGVVRLQSGGRVQDALRAAGGALPGADLARVNLARAAADGEQVVVPAVGEVPAQPAAAPAGAPPVAHPAAAPASPAAAVNLNTADATALDTLPGVGPALAQRILEHRTAHGPFRSVDDLDDVPGIGPAMLEKLRERCTV